MSETTKACENCGSSAIRYAGTNIRGGSAEPHFHCQACGHRSKQADERPVQRTMPDKPPSGAARRLWERGEAEAAEREN